MSLIHQILALLVVVIWGTNFVFIHYGLEELPPFTFVALRFTLVALPLIFFLPKPKTSWLTLCGYGLFIGVGQFGLLFWAMAEDISAGLASLLVQMQAFFTVFLSAFFMKETITRTQLASMLICFSGLALVIFNTDESTTVTGVIIVLFAGFNWACGNLLVKRAQNVNLIAFLAWSSVFAVPPLLLMAWITESHIMINSVTSMSHTALLVLLWQVIGNTLIGYGLWNFLLNRYSTALVAPWALLVPVFGMVSSAILLSEPMPWWKLVAASLIVAGLATNLFFANSKKELLAHNQTN